MWMPVGAMITRAGRSGFNDLRLGARATGMVLPPGSYRVVARVRETAIDQQSPASATFSITK